MLTETTILTRSTAQPTIKAWNTSSALKSLQRYCSLIESTDWDEELLLQEKWINRICLTIIVLSAFYFIPVMLFSLLI
jgi:hypothetical protein